MDIFMLVLYVSVVMSAPMALLLFIYFAAAARYRAGGGEEPYTSGLDYPEEDLSVPDIFFWSIVRYHGRRLYGFLRDRLHNGVLDNWLAWMLGWLLGLFVLVAGFMALGW